MRALMGLCRVLTTVSLLLPGQASGGPISFELVGEVRDVVVSGAVPEGTVAEFGRLGIVTGAPVLVSYRLESTTQDSVPNEAIGTYEGAITRATVSVGDQTWQLRPGDNRVVVSPLDSGYRLTIPLSREDVLPAPFTVFDVRAFYPAGTFPSDDLFLGSLGASLSAIDGLSGVFDSGLAGVSVNVLRIGPVPEPAPLLLIALAIAGVAIRRGRA